MSEGEKRTIVILLNLTDNLNTSRQKTLTNIEHIYSRLMCVSVPVPMPVLVPTAPKVIRNSFSLPRCSFLHQTALVMVVCVAVSLIFFKNNKRITIHIQIYTTI